MLLLTMTLALADPRLDPGVVPVAQTVHLVLDPDADAFDGTTTLTLRLDGPRDALVLHADGPVIDAAALTPGPKLRVTQEPGRVVLRPDRPLPAGTWTLRLRYHAPIREDLTGLYRTELDGRRFLVSQLEPDDARAVVPCLDEPGFKLPWTVTLTVPGDLAAITNAPIVDERRRGAWREVRFAPTRPLPSYLLAFAVGPYEAVPVPGVSRPSTVWVAPGQATAAARLVEVVPQLAREAEAWFGSALPVDKLDLLVAPAFSYGGMENPGLIVLSDAALQVPPVDPATDGRLVEVVGHELAHLWFGDLVTPAWWNDLWLNESFAKWMGLHLRRALLDDPASRAMSVSQTYAALHHDGTSTTRPIRTAVDPDHVFETVNFLAYAKGQALLDAMSAWLGPEAFREGLRRYLAAHADGTATASDLFQALSEVSGEDVAGLMLPYLDRPGAPLVLLSRVGGGWHARQQRYLQLGTDADADAPWPVPLRLRWGDEGAGATRVTRTRLDAVEGPVAGDGAWVMPAADGVGYYVWSLPEPELAALLAHVDALSEAEQVAVANNVMALLDAGLLDLDRAVALTASWRDVAGPAVIGRLLDVVGVVADNHGADDDDALSAWIEATWRPVWARLRDDPAAEQVTRRLEGLLIRHGHDEDLAAAREALVEAALAGRDVPDPARLSAALTAHAREAGLDFQDAVLKLAAGAPTPELRRMYLSAFGRVEAQVARDRALAWLQAPERTLAELRAVSAAVFDKEEEADERLAWSIAQHARLSALTPPQKRAELMRAGAGCDADRFERAAAFYLDPARAEAQSERVAAELREAVHRCAARRAHHGPAVARLLAPWRAP